MKRLNSKFETTFISEEGQNPKNRDYFAFVELNNFACWAISECYDNDPEVLSSELAVQTVLDRFSLKPTLSKRKLKAYVKEADKQLKLQSNRTQLKASILVIATNYKKVVWVVCGNARAYFFRTNNILRQSYDQSLYQQMIDKQQIPNDGSEGLEEARNLFEYLGKPGMIKPVASKKIKAKDEDIILLTTCGFWEKLNSIEILDALENAKNGKELLDNSQELILSKNHELINCYSAASVFINKVYKDDGKIKRRITAILLISIPIILIISIIWAISYNIYKKKKNLIESTVKIEQKGDGLVEDNSFTRALSQYTKGAEQADTIKSNKVDIINMKSRIEQKEKISQLIVDGDELFDSKKYTDAIHNYEKSIKTINESEEFYEVFDTEKLKQKIQEVKDYKYIDALVILGDLKLSVNEYEDAINNYSQAREMAIKINYSDAEKDIKLKIEEADVKLKSKQKEDKLAEDTQKEEEKQVVKLSADDLIIEGDSLVQASDFNGAMSKYNEARTIYTQMKDTAKISEIDKKINEANVKILESVVIEADVLLGNGDYEAAIEKYNIARQNYILSKDSVELAEIDEKIKSINDIIKEEEKQLVLQEAEVLEKKAEKLFEDQYYDKALESYNECKNLYQKLRDTAKIQEINIKIDESKNAISDYKKQLVLLEIEESEKQADELIKVKNYSVAKNILYIVQQKYQSINQLDKVFEIERQIRTLDDLIEKNKQEETQESQEAN